MKNKKNKNEKVETEKEIIKPDFGKAKKRDKLISTGIEETQQEEKTVKKLNKKLIALISGVVAVIVLTVSIVCVLNTPTDRNIEIETVDIQEYKQE